MFRNFFIHQSHKHFRAIPFFNFSIDGSPQPRSTSNVNTRHEIIFLNLAPLSSCFPKQSNWVWQTAPLKPVNKTKNDLQSPSPIQSVINWHLGESTLELKAQRLLIYSKPKTDRYYGIVSVFTFDLPYLTHLDWRRQPVRRESMLEL